MGVIIGFMLLPMEIQLLLMYKRRKMNNFPFVCVIQMAQQSMSGRIPMQRLPRRFPPPPAWAKPGFKQGAPNNDVEYVKKEEPVKQVEPAPLRSSIKREGFEKKKSVSFTEEKPAIIKIEKNRHQLQFPWVWSYRYNTGEKKMTAQEWNDSFKPIGIVDSIELFWQYYNNLPSILELQPKVLFSFFKQGIKPLWEDPANQQGFSLIMYLTWNRIEADDIEKVYLYLLLYLIGYQQPEIVDNISGLTIEGRNSNPTSSICESYKLTIWFSKQIQDRMTMINNMFAFLSFDEDVYSNITQSVIDHKV